MRFTRRTRTPGACNVLVLFCLPALSVGEFFIVPARVKIGHPAVRSAAGTERDNSSIGKLTQLVATSRGWPERWSVHVCARVKSNPLRGKSRRAVTDARELPERPRIMGVRGSVRVGFVPNRGAAVRLLGRAARRSKGTQMQTLPLVWGRFVSVEQQHGPYTFSRYVICR